MNMSAFLKLCAAARRLRVPAAAQVRRSTNPRRRRKRMEQDISRRSGAHQAATAAGFESQTHRRPGAATESDARPPRGASHARADGRQGRRLPGRRGRLRPRCRRSGAHYRDLLKKQRTDRPPHRARGAPLVVGLRYGSGTLHHGVEGDRPVYWTGPSLGFDFGADANKVFVLVYNLHDSQELYKRFPGAAGNAYVLGGFTASYMRRGDVVLIPIRMGVGARLGVNAGYMKFSEKGKWFPF
jgi:hypothetical protein